MDKEAIAPLPQSIHGRNLYREGKVVEHYLVIGNAFGMVKSLYIFDFWSITL
jgi:hypothetical protein